MTEYYKLTNSSCVHNGYVFAEGLNVDYNTYGFSFCKKEDICIWLYYNGMQMKYIWEVNIPIDATRQDGIFGMTTNKFILSNRVEITEFLSKNFVESEKMALKATNQIGHLIGFLPMFLRTEPVYLSAVIQNWALLEDVPKDKITLEMCKAAIKQKQSAINFIPTHFRPYLNTKSKESH